MKRLIRTAQLALLAGFASALVGCATVEPAISQDVEQRRVISTELMKLAADIQRAGGTVVSMTRGNDTVNFRVSVSASQSDAVASILQSAELLGPGGMQRKPDSEPGQTRIIVGAGFANQLPRGEPVLPVASADWDKAPLDFANSTAMQRHLNFERFYPVATERLGTALTRTRLEFIVTGTSEDLASWVACLHNEPGSALLIDNIKLEKYAGRRYDTRPYKLSGDLYVYRRS
jgi:hypothetical protein